MNRVKMITALFVLFSGFLLTAQEPLVSSPRDFKSREFGFEGLSQAEFMAKVEGYLARIEDNPRLTQEFPAVVDSQPGEPVIIYNFRKRPFTWHGVTEREKDKQGLTKADYYYFIPYFHEEYGLTRCVYVKNNARTFNDSDVMVFYPDNPEDRYYYLSADEAREYMTAQYGTQSLSSPMAVYLPETTEAEANTPQYPFSEPWYWYFASQDRALGTREYLLNPRINRYAPNIPLDEQMAVKTKLRRNRVFRSAKALNLDRKIQALTGKQEVPDQSFVNSEQQEIEVQLIPER